MKEDSVRRPIPSAHDCKVVGGVDDVTLVFGLPAPPGQACPVQLPVVLTLYSAKRLARSVADALAKTGVEQQP